MYGLDLVPEVRYEHIGVLQECDQHQVVVGDHVGHAVEGHEHPPACDRHVNVYIVTVSN